MNYKKIKIYKFEESSWDSKEGCEFEKYTNLRKFMIFLKKENMKRERE